MRGYSATQHPRYTLHEEDAEGIKLPSGIIETLERNAFRLIGEEMMSKTVYLVCMARFL